MRRCLILAFISLMVAVIVTGSTGARAAQPDPYTPAPDVMCGPGARPEATQGRVPQKDYDSGRAFKGYYCNAEKVAHFGDSGGYRVYRYTDTKGHVCAIYDTTLLWPTNVTTMGSNGTGVWVLDMSNPAKPKHTATLMTPAMQSPHESLSLNYKRGLLAADMGYPTTQPGFVDIYSVKNDCRHPELLSSTPLGILGHEGGFSPDGKTFWVTSPFGGNLTAIDVSDPRVPMIITSVFNWIFHGFNISDDGTRLYAADIGSSGPSSHTDGSAGVTILDVSDIQKRKTNPQIRFISHLTWKTVSIPQTAIPVTIRGRSYLAEVDEFGSGFAVGAARIIDISDERHPVVVSNLRLMVNRPDQESGPESNDPGADNSLQGYTAHYCAVPQRDEPGIVACSFILSGLRVFDIRDPYNPKELAYFNQPPPPWPWGDYRGSYAMSAPAFDPQSGQIWYSDGYSGFYNVQIAHGVWPFG